MSESWRVFTLVKTWKQTKMSTDQRMYKENVVYTCNGILFIFEKELDSDTYHNSEEPGNTMLNWNKTDTKKQISKVWFHTYEVPSIAKCTK